MSKGNELKHYRESSAIELASKQPGLSLWQRICCFFGFHTWGPVLDQSKVYTFGEHKVMLFHDSIIECKECSKRLDSRKQDVSLIAVLEAANFRWEKVGNDNTLHIFSGSFAEMLKTAEQRKQEAEERAKNQLGRVVVCPAMF
jgi:hypothetical protein